MNLQEKYKKEVVSIMQTKFGYKNAMAVPRVEKVTVNVGVGKIRDEKQQAEIKKYLSLITGQLPNARQAKKAIASFKTRQGMTVGYAATLRGKRMYDFISRFINIALPRTRDFKGIDAKSFDKNGSLTIGVKEHIVFPEMIGEDYKFLFGLEVSVTTNAKKREEGIELLKLMGFPIKNENPESRK